MDLEKAADGNLHIHLHRGGRRHFADIREQRDAFGITPRSTLFWRIDLCNGWEMVPPEDIGAMTAAPISPTRSPGTTTGAATEAGRVYWYPDYQVRDEIKELREHLILVFQGVA